MRSTMTSQWVAGVVAFWLAAAPALWAGPVGVLSARANVRSANTLTSLAFDTKDPGARFRVLEEKKAAAVADSWMKVQFEDGTIGWVQATAAQIVDPEALDVEKRIEAAKFMAGLKVATNNLVALEKKYADTGLLAFGERDQILAAIEAQRAGLNQQLAQAANHLSATEVQAERARIQNELTQSQSELTAAGTFSFAKKKLLKAKLAGLQLSLSAIGTATTAKTQMQSTAAQANDFLNELLGRNAPAQPAISGSPNLPGEAASFKAPPEQSLNDAEREFKEKYQQYINLSSNGADAAQIEAGKQAYLRAYNIYKHLAQQKLTERGAKPETTGSVKLVVDKSARLMQLYDANGDLLRTFPMNFGGVATAAGTMQITHKSNPWYQGDGHAAAPGLDAPAASRWLGVGGNALSIQGGPYLDGFGSANAGACVRMFNEDVDELTDLVAIGTPVSVKQ